MGGRRFVLAMLVGLAGMLALAPTARASFHEILIREVYPGSLAQPDSDYVVLQMYVGGQQFVQGHTLTTYGPGGAQSGAFTFPGNLPNGASQQTILVGDNGVEAALGVKADLESASFALDPTGGAVCWAGFVRLRSLGRLRRLHAIRLRLAGEPARHSQRHGAATDDRAGLPDPAAGGRRQRTTAPMTSSTRRHSRATTPAPIVEQACTGPTTTIDTKPANPTKSTSASFTYHASQVGASFECKLDAAAFAGCETTGVDYPGPLADGQHTFQVRGKSEAGFLGATASYAWRVDTLAPTVTITAKPVDPSPGASASFTFNSSEAGSSFQCSLALGAAADDFSACTSGKTYTNLADGEYTFKVRATDAATNQGAAAVYEWTVDNSLVDTTPPDTLIDSAPPDPSESPSAAFTYHSTEPGSSFECKLDGASFAACPVTGVAYTGLG